MENDQGTGSWVLPCGHEVVDREQTHYCEYISIVPLLALIGPNRATRPREFNHHDEFQFVVVHQIAELAFAVHLHTLRAVIRALVADKLPHAEALLARVIQWTKFHTHLVCLLFTMKPEDFFQFRAPLAPASGAESYQFREIEILSGMRAESDYAEGHGKKFTFRQSIDRQPGKSPGQFQSRWWLERFNGLLNELSLAKAFDEMLARKGLTLAALFSLQHAGDEYQILRRIARKLYEYENAFTTYRERHADAALHQIGGEPGTAGTEGVGYLRAVARIARFHPELHAFMDKRRKEKESGKAWEL